VKCWRICWRAAAPLAAAASRWVYTWQSRRTTITETYHQLYQYQESVYEERMKAEDLTARREKQEQKTCLCEKNAKAHISLLPILLLGSECWSLTKEQSQMLERVHTSCLRASLGSGCQIGSGTHISEKH
jgi:hypothetical protein